MNILGKEIKEFIASIVAVDTLFEKEFDSIIQNREIRSFHLYTVNDRIVFSNIKSNIAILLEGHAIVNHQGKDDELEITNPIIVRNPLEIKNLAHHVKFIYIVCGSDYLDET